MTDDGLVNKMVIQWIKIVIIYAKSFKSERWSGNFCVEFFSVFFIYNGELAPVINANFVLLTFYSLSVSFKKHNNQTKRYIQC